MALDDVPAEAAGFRDPAERMRRERREDARRGAGHAPGPAGARARRRVRGTALLLALASFIAACSERPDRAVSAPASESGPGRILYLTHCQGCHGLEGRGDGPPPLRCARGRPTSRGSGSGTAPRSTASA